MITATQMLYKCFANDFKFSSCICINNVSVPPAIVGNFILISSIIYAIKPITILIFTIDIYRFIGIIIHIMAVPCLIFFRKDFLPVSEFPFRGSCKIIDQLFLITRITVPLKLRCNYQNHNTLRKEYLTFQSFGEEVI